MKPERKEGKTPDPAADQLAHFYEAMNDHFGDLHWWPGDSPLEIVIGAVLTQNTAWRNVELAIRNLKEEQLIHLEMGDLVAVPEGRVESLHEGRRGQ